MVRSFSPKSPMGTAPTKFSASPTGQYPRLTPDGRSVAVENIAKDRVRSRPGVEFRVLLPLLDGQGNVLDFTIGRLSPLCSTLTTRPGLMGGHTIASSRDGHPAEVESGFHKGLNPKSLTGSPHRPEDTSPRRQDWNGIYHQEGSKQVEGHPLRHQPDVRIWQSTQGEATKSVHRPKALSPF